MPVRSLFPTFQHAVRSVVLVQPSSAAAERIFSILKNILEVVGNTPLEDDVESRVFAQVNKRRFE